MPYSDQEKQKEFQKKWYKEHKDRYRLSATAQKHKRQKMIQKIKEIPCFDCGKSYPYYVMDFDHREGEEKLGGINKVIWLWGMEKILAEIAKCDVVCSNCHRTRTFIRSQKDNDLPESNIPSSS